MEVTFDCVLHHQKRQSTVTASVMAILGDFLHWSRNNTMKGFERLYGAFMATYEVPATEVSYSRTNVYWKFKKYQLPLSDSTLTW